MKIRHLRRDGMKWSWDVQVEPDDWEYCYEHYDHDYNENYKSDEFPNSADNIARFIIQVLKSDRYPVEHFMVFMLDTKLKVVGFSDVSKGVLDSSPVHPREVFSAALTTPKCAAIIVAHNHPTGDPTPSSDDITTTKRLYEASQILGVRLLDHVIVGDGCWLSLKSEGYIE